MHDIPAHFPTYWNHEPTSMASTCNSRATWWMVFQFAIEIACNQAFHMLFYNFLTNFKIKHECNQGLWGVPWHKCSSTSKLPQGMQSMHNDKSCVKKQASKHKLSQD